MKSRGGRGIPEEFVARCARIVPDMDEFLAAMTRPVPTTIRVNTLKTCRAELLERLADLAPEPLPWSDLAFRLGDGAAIGRRLEHFAGLVYVQDAASMVPPLLLGPEPGETVLDIAAAPGSKTTQLAAMMANRGLLVANDFSRGRVRGLIGNIDRAGCLNVCVCRMDGIKLARDLEGVCDRVLVDAPCTCEGIMRRTASVLDRWSLDSIAKFSRLQKGLIVAGYRALRPGGLMVYSTCTVAPEENEVVVAYLLERFPEAEVLPAALPGFVMRPGLAAWDGAAFPAALADTRRILPQDNDTEAFFAALVRKPGQGSEHQDTREIPLQDQGNGLKCTRRNGSRRIRYQETRQRTEGGGGEGSGPVSAVRTVAALARRFGIPEPVLAELEAVFAPNQGTVFLATPGVMRFDAVRPMRRGIRLCRVFPHSVKPTTHAMQLLGRHATRNRVEVSRDQAVALIAGGQVEIESDCEDGFALINCEGFTVGVGLYHRPVLKSQIPRFRPVDG